MCLSNCSFRTAYSKATKRWKVRVVKQAKSYDYIPELMLDIARYREVSESIQRLDSPVGKHPNDPSKKIPTIAAVPKPAKRQLILDYANHHPR